MNTAENIDVESAIDAAIAKAKARAAAKGSRDDGTPRVKLTSEERAQRQAELKQQREQRRLEKAAKVSTGPVHMKKVERAASALPKLTDAASGTLDDIITNFSPDQISALALHLQHHNRVVATQRAVATGPLRIGQVVRITGGDPRFIGMTGALERVQRIRCYVKVPGVERLIYCFTSDVEKIVDSGEVTNPVAIDEAPESTGAPEQIAI